MDKDLKKKRIIVGAVLIAVLGLTVAICIPVAKTMIRFADSPDAFRDWVELHGIWGCLAYVGINLLQVIFAIIPGEPLEILGGYAFGAVKGSLLCLAAQALGSVIVFFLVRKYGMRLVRIFFSEESLSKIRFLKSSRKRDMLFMLFFTLPGTPKDLLCYFAGLADISLPVWLVTCTLGRIPSIVTSTVGGDALGDKSYVFAVIVFAVTVCVSVGGIAVYNAICKRHNKKS